MNTLAAAAAACHRFPTAINGKKSAVFFHTQGGFHYAAWRGTTVGRRGKGLSTNNFKRGLRRALTKNPLAKSALSERAVALETPLSPILNGGTAVNNINTAL